VVAWLSDGPDEPLPAQADAPADAPADDLLVTFDIT